MTLRPIPLPAAPTLAGGVPTTSIANLAAALKAQNNQGLQQALAQSQQNVMQAGTNYNALRQLMGGTTPFSNYLPANYPHGGGGGGGGGHSGDSSNGMLTGSNFGMGFGTPTNWQSVYGPPVASGMPNSLATGGGGSGGGGAQPSFTQINGDTGGSFIPDFVGPLLPESENPNFVGVPSDITPDPSNFSPVQPTPQMIADASPKPATPGTGATTQDGSVLNPVLGQATGAGDVLSGAAGAGGISTAGMSADQINALLDAIYGPVGNTTGIGDGSYDPVGGYS